MTDGRQEHDIGYEGPYAEVKESGQKSRSGEIRTRSGCISHRAGMLGLTNSKQHMSCTYRPVVQQPYSGRKH